MRSIRRDVRSTGDKDNQSRIITKIPRVTKV